MNKVCFNLTAVLHRLPPVRGKRMKAMQEKRKNKPHCSLPFLPALAAFRDSDRVDLICRLQLSQFLSDSTFLSLTSENNGKIANLKYCFCDLSVKRYLLHFSFP